MNNLTSVKKAFIITIFSLFTSGLITYVTIYLFKDNDAAERASQIGLILGELILLMPILIYFTGQSNLKRRLRLNRVNFPIILLTVVISLGISPFLDELDRLMTYVLHPPDVLFQLAESMKADDTTSRILLFIGAVLFAAIAEELLFRGFLQQVLEDQWQDVTKAVLVTSIFFAAIHFIPWWLIQIYLLGVILGFLAWKTNSVYPSIVFHGINNGLAFTFANWGDQINPWYLWKGHVSPILLIIGGIFLIIGFKYFAITGKMANFTR